MLYVVMQKLLKRFYIVHTHGCNCAGTMKVSGTDKGMPQIVEVTFLRKDIGTISACVASKYLSIDKPTCKGKEYTEADFVLRVREKGFPVRRELRRVVSQRSDESSQP